MFFKSKAAEAAPGAKRAPARPALGADGELDARALGRALWRRKRAIVLPTLIVAVLAGFLVTGWALGPAPFFWPMWPLFWLGVSLIVHHRRARRVPAGSAEGP